MSIIGLVPCLHLNTSYPPQLSTSKMEFPSGSRWSASHKEPGAMRDVHSGKSELEGHSEVGISSKKQAPKKILIKVIKPCGPSKEYVYYLFYINNNMILPFPEPSSELSSGPSPDPSADKFKH